MTRRRSFSILIVSFHIFLQGNVYPIIIVRKKERKEGRKEKRKRKRWARY